MKRLFLFLTIVCFLASCISQRRKEAVPPEYITVMTYNIHHAVGIDGIFDPDRIAKLIREYDVDLVALQEVDVETERVNGIHIMKYLADTLDMTWIFGKNLSFQGGGYGNGILSKYPVIFWENDHLQSFDHGEQRGLLQSVIDVKGMRIDFWNTHLDHRSDDRERRKSVSTILEKTSSVSSSLFIAGDFNDTPESPAIRAMTEVFQDVWTQSGENTGLTFPADSAARRIDYLFYHNWPEEQFTLKPIRARVLKSPASDHLPLIVTFEIIPQK